MFSLEERSNRRFTKKQLLWKVVMYAEKMKANELNRKGKDKTAIRNTS